MTNSSSGKSDASRAACRFCKTELKVTVVDLGMSPPCQTHIEPDQLNHMERFYPLYAWVCDKCFLVQLEEYVSPDSIFSDYAYFSSFSDSWVEHARRYVDMIANRCSLDAKSLVMEIASNDGYLLQHFVTKGIPCRGIEPAANVAEAAVAKGIPTTVRFFGQETAKIVAAEHGRPDLLLGNNVLAHVPDINDFVGGMKTLLKQGGVITMEFPHLLRLMDENQFDTIYHEHFSYLSFSTVEEIFVHHGLTLFDVEEVPTHGGSLRIFDIEQRQSV
ncbi:MAG TPA: methyltransferase domain-containing protein, partial [Steroidobacteraceae bacterium]|nr:methyltransferase domain-containing protein [Steroidobacteraceae bacterium]